MKIRILTISFDKELSGFDSELIEEIIGIEVDINTYNGLNYYNREGLKKEVLSEQEKII